jgi:translation initiation factor 1 (eIF-1/SUI1)
MSDEAEASASSVPAPLTVAYDPITGVPAEYNEYLPADSAEYKKWKASQEGPEGLEKLKITDASGQEIEKKLPGGKVKKKQKPAIVIETNVRNKKKCVTTVSGLDLFGVKLSEASKAFGKKFASGASVTKAADGKEQIDIQGDFLSQVAELIIKNYGKANSIAKSDVYFIGEVRGFIGRRPPAATAAAAGAGARRSDGVASGPGCIARAAARGTPSRRAHGLGGHCHDFAPRRPLALRKAPEAWTPAGRLR